jgi:hypothetical protein
MFLKLELLAYCSTWFVTWFETSSIGTSYKSSNDKSFDTPFRNRGKTQRKKSFDKRDADS